MAVKRTEHRSGGSHRRSAANRFEPEPFASTRACLSFICFFRASLASLDSLAASTSAEASGGLCGALLAGTAMAVCAPLR